MALADQEAAGRRGGKGGELRLPHDGCCCWRQCSEWLCWAGWRAKAPRVAAAHEHTGVAHMLVIFRFTHTPTKRAAKL